MFKFGSTVFPVAVRSGFLIVSLFLLSEPTAVKVLAQEAPPQSEEQRQARELLNQGVHNFKNGQYDEAIAAFQRARQLDARLVNARLYLDAMAYLNLL